MIFTTTRLTPLAALSLLCLQHGLAAQKTGETVGPPQETAGPPEETGAEEGGPPSDFGDGKSVFDDNWITLGLGAGLSPSYTGSNDYRPFPLPVVQGKLLGVGISPRGAGVALDLIPGRGINSDYSFGPTIRLRSDRADDIEDPVVELAGELDRAVEVGFSAGLTKRQFSNLLDSVTVSVDARADVAGAHNGFVVEPSISYFTPVDFGTAVSFSLNASIVDDNYADYYFSVSPVQSTASGLPQFSADGGLQSIGSSVFIAYDLDGNAVNGGLSAVFIGSYSRLLGDAADTPYTAQRGDPNQFFAGVGLGYTF